MIGRVIRSLTANLTPRELSRKVQNARRKLERRRTKLESELTRPTSSKRALYDELESIDTALAQAKYNRKTKSYAGDVLDVLDRATSRAERGLDPNVLSRKEQFRWDIANSGNAVGTMDAVSASVFMRLTQEAWQGLPTGERLDAIMDAFGSNDLYEIYNTVMSTEEAQEALKQLQGTEDEDSETAEQDRYRAVILKIIPMNLQG